MRYINLHFTYLLYFTMSMAQKFVNSNSNKYL